MIRIISASARIGGSNFLPPYLWWRLGAMRARARERRLRASERPPGGVGGARGELAAPGRRAGFLGPPSGCWGPERRPRWATGGCPPPRADGRPGCARSGGENRKFPPRRWLRSVPRGQPMATWQHGNMATWQHGNMASWHRGNMATWQHGNMATWRHGIVASWHRLVSGGAAQAGMGNQLSTPTEK